MPFVSRVDVVQESVEALTQNPFARAFYGFLAMEIAFIVLILTAGVGLILYAASLERDVEFAAIIARGSSGWQTAKLLVGEAFVIMLVGLTIGVGVGAGTGFLASQWLATGPTGIPTSPVPYFFVFPWEAVLLVVLGPASMLLSALVVSIRTARLNVAKVLKLRGG
jgi:ABC-type antimicrobial peptide transport system permease subunit